MQDFFDAILKGAGRSRGRPRLLGALTIGLTALAALPAPASAEPEPIPIVNMSKAGPDTELPTGGAFYLSGKVDKKVTAVYPVFVRVANPALGLGGPTSCVLAQKALNVSRLIKVDGTPVLEKKSGIFLIDKLWSPPDAGDGPNIIDEFKRLNTRHNAYVPPAWVRPEAQADAEDASYKVLVSEPRWFRPGATYCLFLYEQNRISEQERREIPKLLWDHRTQRAACETGSAAADTGRCASEADKKLIDNLNKLLSDVGREKAKEVLFNVRTSLINAAGVMSSFLPEIKTALEPARWVPRFNTGASAWSPPRDFLDVDADPLARLLVELLASKGHVYRLARPPRSSGETVDGKKVDCAADKEICKGRVEYTARSGAIGIQYIRMRPALDVFEIASDSVPKPAQRDEVSVGAGALPMYAAGVTLEDAMEFARGRIKAGGRYLAFADLYGAVVRPAVEKQEQAFAKTGTLAESPELKDLSARIEALRQAVSLACSGAAAAKAATSKGKAAAGAEDAIRAAIAETDRMPFEQAVQALAGLWLEKSALSDCNAYASPARDPLSDIAEVLERYLDAVKTWRESESVMTLQITRLSTEHPRSAPLALEGRMTQETFFDHYVTPFLGRTSLLRSEGEIAMTYAGLQLYLWPNDVREPMWSNGSSDLRRLLALELGVSLETAEFGDGNRFSGLGPLPPIFAGVAFQTLPYVTLSGGVALMERRRSTLLTEDSQFYASFYMGATVQFNVIGIVRNLTSGRGSSQVEEE